MENRNNHLMYGGGGSYGIPSAAIQFDGGVLVMNSVPIPCESPAFPRGSWLRGHSHLYQQLNYINGNEAGPCLPYFHGNGHASGQFSESERMNRQGDVHRTSSRNEFRRSQNLQRDFRTPNSPHLRVLPTEGVVILDALDSHNANNFMDRPRNVRRDGDLSYEGLLALGDLIGRVGTGLSQEAIRSCLVLRTFDSDVSCRVNGNEEDISEKHLCVICQAHLENEEEIGMVGCGHEFHGECIMKWLHINNTCPICKLPAKER